MAKQLKPKPFFSKRTEVTGKRGEKLNNLFLGNDDEYIEFDERMNAYCIVTTDTVDTAVGTMRYIVGLWSLHKNHRVVHRMLRPKSTYLQEQHVERDLRKHSYKKGWTYIERGHKGDFPF